LPITNEFGAYEMVEMRSTLSRASASSFIPVGSPEQAISVMTEPRRSSFMPT
jgi:hypothetical protein